MIVWGNRNNMDNVEKTFTRLMHDHMLQIKHNDTNYNCYHIVEISSIPANKDLFKDILCYIYVNQIGRLLNDVLVSYDYISRV